MPISTITREVKKDTIEILNDTAAIKDDTAQILDEIARLQARLPEDASERKSNFVLQRYLESLTTYAESVCDTSTDDRPQTPQSSHSSIYTEGYSYPNVSEQVFDYQDVFPRASSLGMTKPTSISVPSRNNTLSVKVSTSSSITAGRPLPSSRKSYGRDESQITTPSSLSSGRTHPVMGRLSSSESFESTASQVSSGHKLASWPTKSSSRTNSGEQKTMTPSSKEFTERSVVTPWCDPEPAGSLEPRLPAKPQSLFVWEIILRLMIPKNNKRIPRSHLNTSRAIPKTTTTGQIPRRPTSSTSTRPIISTQQPQTSELQRLQYYPNGFSLQMPVHEDMARHLPDNCDEDSRYYRYVKLNLRLVKKECLLA
jgi:hypothetical protein